MPRAICAGFSRFWPVVILGVHLWPRLRLQGLGARAYTGTGMKPQLRIYLAIVLAVMLALTGQSMAVARGASGPAGQVVLCTGTGPVSVLVDENGAPTGPAYFCPDCALSSLAAIALPGMVILPIVARPMVLPFRAAQLHGISPRIRALARAPPQAT